MKAQRKRHNGTPTVFLDGQPAFFGCHLIGGIDPDEMLLQQPWMRRYRDAGVHIYSCGSPNDIWQPHRRGEPVPYDFTVLDAGMQRYIDADPAALFLMRMQFDTRWSANHWWNETYPDEVEVLSNGERWGNSFASTVWREQVGGVIRATVAHLRENGVLDRVIAIQLGAGSSGEWVKDMSSMLLPTLDYSPPMRRHFRAWLADKYATDAALQAAWANEQVTLATAEVPSYDQQHHTASGNSFRDPRHERQTIDFFECFADLVAGDLISFAEAAREATQGEKLIGAFFGYIMDLSWNMAFFSGQQNIAEAEVSTAQASGHLGLRRVLQSPAIDFLVSPQSYAFRGLGGDCLAMPPAESLRHHGKIYIMEEDTLMHNGFDPGGRNHRLEHNLSMYQRNFAQILTHAHGATWFETLHLHEHPDLEPARQQLIARFQQLGTWALGIDRTPSSQVGVFVDDESYFYESIKTNVDLPAIWRQRVTSLNRFGAPHDIYLLNDLLDGGLPDYKLYVFLNAFHLSNARRAKLKEILRRQGKTALWLYAPGLLNSDAPADQPAIHADHMTDLTGLRFVQCDGAWSPLMHVINFTHPVTRGLPQDWFWGSTNPIGPTFHLEDPEAVTLGQTVYTLGRCKPGLGLRTFAGDWTSVYCASPDIPAPVLRGIARHAGVHLYSEAGDVLYATPTLLSAHTVSGGPRTFALPQRAEVVYDLLAAREVARDTAAFNVELEPASTALWFAGPRAQLPPEAQ